MQDDVVGEVAHGADRRLLISVGLTTGKFRPTTSSASSRSVVAVAIENADIDLGRVDVGRIVGADQRQPDFRYCAMKSPSLGISHSDSNAGTHCTDSEPELDGRAIRAVAAACRRRRRHRRQQFGTVRRQFQALAGALS